ncbi:MAG TPA: hypothetical protein VEP30_05995 [Chthoniobacterales bacterium]|nr:hypothetical protein [Chthoniobacterales bacterium]
MAKSWIHLVRWRRAGWLLFYSGVLIGLCDCEKQDLKDVNAKLDVVVQQTFSVASEMPELKRTYGLWDDEHKRVVGMLKNAPPLQVGSIIDWDDDVYQVQSLRFVTRKSTETLLDDKNKTAERSVDMEVVVKFVGKLKPTE